MLHTGGLLWLLPLMLVASGDSIKDSESVTIGRHQVSPHHDLWIGSSSNSQLGFSGKEEPAQSTFTFGLPPGPAIPPVSAPFFGDPPPTLNGYFGHQPAGAPPTHPTSQQIPNWERVSRRE